DRNEEVLGIMRHTTEAFEQGLGEGAVLERVELQGALPAGEGGEDADAFVGVGQLVSKLRDIRQRIEAACARSQPTRVAGVEDQHSLARHLAPGISTSRTAATFGSSRLPS